MGRRSQREAAREALVEAGLRRLQADGVEALRALLTANALSREGVSPHRADVPRGSAYRAFAPSRRMPRGDRTKQVNDEIVRAVVERACDEEWCGLHETGRAVLGAYLTAIEADENDPAAAILAALRVNVDQQLSQPGQAVGWLVHAAAFAASPAYTGPTTPDEEQTSLGRYALEQRREFFRRMSGKFEEFLTGAMSVLHRRPAPGYSTAVIVELLHCLMDGAVLRKIVDPDSLDSTTIADAMLRLGLACSTPGTHHDPRRPLDIDAASGFDAAVARASESLALGESPRSVLQACAAATGLPVADAADSILRASSASGGVASTEATSVEGLIATLGVVAGVASQHPQLAEAARLPCAAGPAMFGELVALAVAVLARHGAPAPDSTAEGLADWAYSGRSVRDLKLLIEAAGVH